MLVTPGLGDRGRHICRVHWPANLARLVSSVSNPVSKNIVDDSQERMPVTVGLYLHTHKPARTHTLTRSHTHTKTLNRNGKFRCMDREGDS